MGALLTAIISWEGLLSGSFLLSWGLLSGSFLLSWNDSTVTGPCRTLTRWITLGLQLHPGVSKPDGDGVPGGWIPRPLRRFRRRVSLKGTRKRSHVIILWLLDLRAFRKNITVLITHFGGLSFRFKLRGVVWQRILSNNQKKKKTNVRILVYSHHTKLSWNGKGHLLLYRLRQLLTIESSYRKYTGLLGNQSYSNYSQWARPWAARKVVSLLDRAVLTLK